MVWAQRAELTGRPFPPARAAGRELPGLVIDLDASIVVCHSEKEQAAPTFKKTFGYPPDAGVLRQHRRVPRRDAAARATRAATPPPTTSPSWTPRSRSCPTSTATAPRSWSAPTPPAARGSSSPTSAACAIAAVSCEFSVGWAITAKERAAIAAIPAWLWADAVDADGGHRDGAGLAEITRVLPARALVGYPPGIRVIVRRERPHPGAQLDAFEEADGWRYTAFATDTRVGQLARLDARHRAHARVEDRIRCAKDTGLDHFPSRSFAINQAWLTVVMLAVDLIAWTQHLLLLRRSGQGRAEDAALPAAARRRPAHPRTAPALAAHPTLLALGPRPRRGVRPARDAARPRWLIVDPDTTSGGSYRQNQHAGAPHHAHLQKRTATTEPEITRSIRGPHE